MPQTGSPRGEAMSRQGWRETSIECISRLDYTIKQLKAAAIAAHDYIDDLTDPEEECLKIKKQLEDAIDLPDKDVR